MSHQNEIIYVYDALCGWCYGFSPVIKKLAEKYADQIPFSILSGGMVIGSRVGPISNMAAYIQKAYKTVEDHTGIKFGEPFLNGILNDPHYISNSETPSIALTAFKHFQPQNAIAFAHNIQKAFHYEGKSLNDSQTYLDLAAEFGIAGQDFRTVFQDEKTIGDTREEFAQVMEWGISGFPTLLLKTEDKMYALARGYRDFESLDQVFGQILNPQHQV